MYKNAFRLFCALLVAVFLAESQFALARAATIMVVNADDSGPGSLRQAILDAQTGDTINFDASLSGALIPLASTLTIDKNLTIDGSNLASHASLIGQNVRAVLINQAVTVTLISLNLRAWAIDAEFDGAGIYNNGILTLDDCELSRSYLEVGRRGVLYNTGNVTMTNSAVAGNITDYGGVPGIFNTGTIRISNSTISGNRAGVISFSGGSAISTSGIMAIDNSTLSGNAGIGSAGVITNGGTLTITNSTFSGNQTVVGDGGAISNYGTLTITNSTFFKNKADSDSMCCGQGGGIYNSSKLIVKSSTFSENNADHGGGIYNAGNLQYSNTIIANSKYGGDCVDVGNVTSTSNLVEDGSCSAALSGDPRLGTLADNGGITQTLALLPGSPAIDAGRYAYAPGTDQRGISRPQGTFDDIGAYEAGKMIVFRSSGAYDGGVVESSETSEVGGSSNSSLPTFKVGDSAQNRQFRAILSFNTSSLPNDAVVFHATLKIKQQTLTGSNPFTTHNELIADIKEGVFGGSAILVPQDFQAQATQDEGCVFASTPQGLWYVAELDSSALGFINKSGHTQFRLRFNLDDDNDNMADFFTFFSGNYSKSAARPILWIEYYIP